jgi:predicted dithiol-disulfide oxidoreductase (DUF899 family)
MLENHRIVSHEEWLDARITLLEKEKQFTRMRDALSRERRELPWERVSKDYIFDGPNGTESLAQLFESRSQLLVYHFMFAPEWDAGCPHCSFWADSFDRNVIHLNHRDVTMVAISRASLNKLQAFKARMGWTFKWVSSGGNDFNHDYYVSFRPEDVAKGEIYHNYRMSKGLTDHAGLSVFYKDSSGAIFHTYSCYARGLDMLNAAYNYLDLVPKGRDEKGPFKASWVRYRDKYED